MLALDQNVANTGPIPPSILAIVTGRLLTLYGGTMGYTELAAELHTTPGAVRLRQFRVGDLPPPIPGLKCHRWPTPAVAAWLCRFATLPVAQSQLASPSPHSVRRGRPRTHRAAPTFSRTAGGAQP